MSAVTKKDNFQAAWSGLVLLVVTFMLVSIYFLRLGSTDLVSYEIDPNLVIYQAMRLVIVETNDNLYVIEGTGQNFEDIVSYFELI